MIDWKTYDYDKMSLDECIELLMLYANEDENSGYGFIESSIKNAKKYNTKSVLKQFIDKFGHKDPKTKPLSLVDWETCGLLATLD